MVRIQLIGKSEAMDGFQGITEVAQAANASDGPSVAAGQLGIVEIEFHEAVRSAIRPSNEKALLRSVGLPCGFSSHSKRAPRRSP
jgi:hypothetical protein